MQRPWRFIPCKERVGTSNPLSQAELWCGVHVPHCCFSLTVGDTVECGPWNLGRSLHSHRAELSQQGGCSSGSQVTARNAPCSAPRTPMFHGASGPAHDGEDSHCPPTFTFCFPAPKESHFFAISKIQRVLSQPPSPNWFSPNRTTSPPLKNGS